MGPMSRLGLRPKKIIVEDLRRGDQICTDRRLKSFYHHGIYIGKERVIHFTKVSAHNHARGTEICGHEEGVTTTDPCKGVRMCCLDCFVDGHSLYRFEYNASLSLTTAPINLGGSIRECDDEDKVVARAVKALEDDKFGEWALCSNNCETFAYFCKTGERRSKQVMARVYELGLLGALFHGPPALDLQHRTLLLPGGSVQELDL